VAGADAEATIEVHALDFQGDLYGQRVAVEFVQWIRGEAKFASLDALKAAIAADVEQARKVFIQ
jgi:riboflavin kinase / FMN adenylyltransferase